MKLLERIDWSVLNDYIEKKLIVANKHSEYDIWILNYSPTTQIERVWDDYTLSCRGLVIDGNGDILARPFQKFKNYEEYDPSEVDMSLDFDIFEKMDGSLIILFYYRARDKWIVASRGSFMSEQSLEAEKMLNPNVFEGLSVNLTYLFEVIYPENRIVVDYGDMRQLVLLAVIETSSGYEVSYEAMYGAFSSIFTIVKKYPLKNITDLLDLKKLEEDNKEGFVVKFSNGFRVKVKFAEYIRLHGVLTNVSNLTIWRHLMNGDDFDMLLDKVPDEFYDWLKRTVKTLEQKYNEIERLALKEFVRIYRWENLTDRKEFALEALKSKEYNAIMFKLYENRPYDNIIWKKVRPVFSKPFKDGYAFVD